MLKNILIGLLGLTLVGCANEFYYSHGDKITVTQIKTQKSNKASNNQRYYKTSQGVEVAVTDEILVECKKNIDCKALLSHYPLKSVSQLSNSIYLVSIEERENIFRMSQKLYEEEGTLNAHPNFIKTRKRR